MRWHQLLKTDVARLRGGSAGRLWMLKVLVHPSLHAIALYRLSHACHARGIVPIAKICRSISIILTGCDIDPSAEIGPGFQIGHTLGIVVGPNVKIGPRATIMQNVTLGRLSPNIAGMPSLGADVAVGAGAIILGPIYIGNGSGIGAGALVIENVPANARVATEPARIIKLDGVKQKSSAATRIAELELAVAQLILEQEQLKRQLAQCQIHVSTPTVAND